VANPATTLIGNPFAQLDLPEGLTRSLIDLVHDLDVAAVPDEVRTWAKHSLIDTVGVLALGSVAEPVQMLRRVVLEPATDGATVFGPEPVRASPLNAAMVNALAAHIRDFDDAGAGGHISAIIVPAVLALAEVHDKSGAGALSALIAGYETAFRVNRLLGDSHYYLGFHSSGTVGTFAAAAACCRLLGASREQWAMAFGIAGSLAGGLLANFGSMTKPLHSANAARAGMLAARLAQEGFTGSPTVLEHEVGFIRTHTLRPDAFTPGGPGGVAPPGDTDPTVAMNPPGEPWALSDMYYKFNAACSGTHSGGDGMRRLVAEHGVTADDVAQVTIRVPKIQTEVANIQWPATVEQAKFSIRFVAAAGLLGINTAEAFPTEDSAITDPRVQSVIGLIEVLPLDGVNHGGAAEIDVRLKTGEMLGISLNSMVPFDDIGTERGAIEDKFRRTAATLWSPAVVDDTVRRLACFEQEPSVRAFLADLGRG
jgi:2-methylcitrate dehydratase PrpD